MASSVCCGSGVEQVIPEPAAAADASIVHWGNDLVGSSTTPRFLSPGYDDTLATVDVISWIAPRDGELQDLFVLHNAPAGNGNNITYTVRVNGIATALSVTLSSLASSGSNLVATVPVLQGDLIDIRITKAAVIASSPRRVMASLLYA
jgi:hypothetical protein